MNKVLKALYYSTTHPAGYAGARGILKCTKGKFKSKDVIKWLESQDTYTLHKPARVNFKRNRYISNNIDQTWEADLNDMRGLAEYNDGVNYLLSVIDVFSKYGFIVPLKNKTNQSVKKAFEFIFESTGRRPENLRTDKGSEFTGKSMIKFFEDNDINYFTTKNPDIKASNVEIWNKTIKTRMWRYLTHHNTYRYIDVVTELVESYNKTKHSTIQMCPADVNERNILQVWKHTYSQAPKYVKPRYSVGDSVRIAKERKHFKKGYESKWSEEIFNICRVIKHPRPLYELRDGNNELVDGYFYEQEVQRISKSKDKVFKIDKIISSKGKGRSMKLLVKWKGYSSDFNSWIPASNIVSITNG